MTSSSPDLSARQLRAVTALARNGSFIAAAAELGLSQPALTRTIKQTEAVLGIALFARSTRRVALTAAGREFVPLAERFLSDLDIGIRNMRELGGRQRGQIVVACLMSVAYSVLPPVIRAYRERYPGIQLQLRENVQGVLQEEVQAGIADFGIGDVAAPHPSLIAEPLRQETFHVTLPRDHPLARRKTIRMAELRGETIISMPVEAGIRRIIDGAAQAAGISVAYDITVNQFATVYTLIRGGVGIAIVPAAALPPPDDPALAARPLVEPAITRRLGVLHRADRPPSPAAQGFLELLRPHFANLPSGRWRKRVGVEPTRDV